MREESQQWNQPPVAPPLSLSSRWFTRWLIYTILNSWTDRNKSEQKNLNKPIMSHVTTVAELYISPDSHQRQSACLLVCIQVVSIPFRDIIHIFDLHRIAHGALSTMHTQNGCTRCLWYNVGIRVTYHCDNGCSWGWVLKMESAFSSAAILRKANTVNQDTTRRCSPFGHV